MEGAGTVMLVLCREPALLTSGSRYGPVLVREQKYISGLTGTDGLHLPKKGASFCERGQGA